MWALVLVWLLGASWLQAAPIKEECRKVWNRQGFTEAGGENGEGKKNTLFNPGQKESYGDFISRLKRSECEKEWLVLVYMAADNDLSPYSFRDIWEMESIGSRTSIDVLVFQDHAQSEGMFTYHIAKSTKSFEFKDMDEEIEYWKKQGAKGVASPMVQSFPEGDSGDVKQLTEFVSWAMEKYPAKRVMLIGWSHGQGFDGFAFDETPQKNHMQVTQMASQLQEKVKKEKVKKLDILGSDACLNQQIEFAYEWTGLADYVFGSSTIVQKKGFNYHALLKWFAEHPYDSTANLAKKIPSLYGGSVSSGSGKKYSSYYDPYATMATWTVSELRFLKIAIEDLGKVLSGWIEESKEDELERIKRLKLIRKIFNDTLRLGGISNDLFYFLLVLESHFKENKKIYAEIQSTRDCLQRSILGKYIGSKYQKGLLSTSLGAAIWLPQDKDEYGKLFEKFSKGQFYGEKGPWTSFLKLVYE